MKGLTDDSVFNYSGANDQADLETTIRSVAFLLEVCSHSGNEPLDGFAALGLSKILHECANDLDRFFTADEVHQAGGDALSLPRVKAEIDNARAERDKAKSGGAK